MACSFYWLISFDHKHLGLPCPRRLSQKDSILWCWISSASRHHWKNHRRARLESTAETETRLANEAALRDRTGFSCFALQSWYALTLWPRPRIHDWVPVIIGYSTLLSLDVADTAVKTFLTKDLEEMTEFHCHPRHATVATASERTSSRLPEYAQFHNLARQALSISNNANFMIIYIPSWQSTGPREETSNGRPQLPRCPRQQ